MSIEQWMKENPELVYQTLGELSVSKLARLIEDDIALGAYLFEQLNETYKGHIAATHLPKEPDTERMREARAINAEARRAW
jgi:hypothetical protein